MSYLSVNKFAEKVGVSRQAIYQRIKRAEPQFMKFVTKEGSSTKISEDAVILFENVNVNTNYQDKNVNVNTQDVNSNDTCKFDNVNIDTKSKCKDVNINADFVNIDTERKYHNVNANTKFVNVDIEQMQNQISKLLEIQEKHLKQIETLYTQLSDKDKLIEQLSTQILNQTRLPVIIEQPKQTLWQKIKLKIFK